jgi:hypothetical protein
MREGDRTQRLSDEARALYELTRVTLSGRPRDGMALH